MSRVSPSPHSLSAMIQHASRCLHQQRYLQQFTNPHKHSRQGAMLSTWSFTINGAMQWNWAQRSLDENTHSLNKWTTTINFLSLHLISWEKQLLQPAHPSEKRDKWNTHRAGRCSLLLHEPRKLCHSLPKHKRRYLITCFKPNLKFSVVRPWWPQSHRPPTHHSVLHRFLWHISVI